MVLDFSEEWRIVRAGEAGDPDGPVAFAATELASIIARMGCRAPVLGEGGASERTFVLNSENGRLAPSPGGRRRAPGFSWRAAPGRVEIRGEDGGGLLRGVYDFLEALGARWVAPGARGERLPRGPVFRLTAPFTESYNGPSLPGDAKIPATTLILGHGAYLERWEDYLLWAARAGYASVFVHTTPDALAIGAAPRSLYEALRVSIGATARRLGLGLELGGHGLSALLPRSLFKAEPELFRESGGKRVSDRNFCPSSGRALALASEAFAAGAAGHPEISVFHLWPDDLPEGGWCSCAACASLSPAAQSLKAARALAAALAGPRPDAALSYLAYHDTENVASVLGTSPEGGTALPPNLELLWAPRLRSWGSPLNDDRNELNAASLSSFRRVTRAWRASGGGRVAVFEYWEDAFLFKSAVPPLAAVIEGDLAAYGGGAPEDAADAIGILCAGGRLPLAPRPNVYLMPRLAASARNPSRSGVQDLLSDWTEATHGPTAAPMLEYWRELGSAWSIDLDLLAGDCAVHRPESMSRCASDPPADWGDPWMAGPERLARKRGRCEELFDHLRLAEAKLSEAISMIPGAFAEETQAEAKGAVGGEASEYAISGSVLELDCARLSSYHELAAGESRAAADIANLALSASGAVRKALSRLPDPRARREMSLIIEIFYDLKLRAIRRANARSGLRRLVDLWYTTARSLLAALPVMRAYEAKGIASPTRRH